MAWNETPIYPGKPLNGQANVPVSAAATYTLFTADATYGGMIDQLRLYTKTTTARTCRLELKNGSTVTVLSRFSTGTTQYAVIDLMSSTYLPVNANDPRLTMAAGEILQLVTEDTNAGNFDVTAIGSIFQYPN